MDGGTEGEMKVLLQRVARAAVRVDGETVGTIGPGLLVFLGVESGDTADDAAWYADKTAELRLFADEEGRMNRSVEEAGGAVLVVSQFTLAARTRRGRRPSFDAAAPPDEAEARYRDFVDGLRRRGIETATGRFRAMMEVELVNEGPVTILLDPRIAER